MFGFEKEDLPPYIKVEKSHRAKRLALRLNPKERLFHLVIPRGMSLSKAQAFAEEHDRWMKEKLRDLPRPVRFRDGAVVPVMGRNRTIKIVTNKKLKSTEILLKHNELLVFTNLEEPAQRIVRFLKDLAKKELWELSSEKAARLGRKIKNVSVRDTKSRWGSCAQDGSLCYSWRLIFAPSAAFDYVVAHEVAHLKKLDHSKEFWTVCRRLSENFLEGQFWMHNHGQELMRYGFGAE
ncbi:MAG: M48 family metallopeptidase [Alphaproteobacteria bacterium]|nr:M48 family metallopeptidase [Alphaproteobacteria bacterium]